MTIIQIYLKVVLLFSPLEDFTSILDQLSDFLFVKFQLLSGNYEPFIWWMLYFLLSIIQLILIFYLCWLVLKHLILLPDNQDRRNFRKMIVGLLLITFFQILTNKQILYPLLNFNTIF